MNKTINNLTVRWAEKQKTLFLIDTLGALLTAIFLFVIMRHFSRYFGMPKTGLACLWTTAVCFCIYSAACFLFLKGPRVFFIRIIGAANLLYCVLLIGLLIKFRHLLTIIGTAYFLIEIAIISALGYLELNVAKEIKNGASAG